MRTPTVAMPAHVCEMMMRLGIDPAQHASPKLKSTYTKTFRQCEHCRFTKACEEWLDSAPALIGSPPWFCINSDQLLDLQCDQGFSCPLPVKRKHPR